jgi:site-specific DNA-methyltransferase (adenine-specific)
MNDIFNDNVSLKTETPAFAKHLLGAVPSVVYNEDCVEGLKRFSDNHFDLAIVDPPYGINRLHSGGMPKSSGFKKWERKDWDSEIPKAEYWEQLFRVSKNQIVWGGNYFTEYLKPSQGWVFWFKQKGMTFADGELAWTSFDKATRQYDMSGMGGANRIHPTQKPIKLYDWILQQYGSDANLILDTHVGSGSSRIACNKAGKQFVGFEIDTDYYEAQEKRFKDFVSQLRMF